MKHSMISALRNKVRTLLNGDFTFYRMLLLLRSKNGPRKLKNFFVQVLKYLAKKALGIHSRMNQDYRQWMDLHYPNADRLKEYAKELDGFAYKPLVSVLLPVYDPPLNFLREAIDSVIAQVYPNWELCIADDLSVNEEVRTLIREYAEKDKRIRFVFRAQNGHISESSNSALDMARGEFIALLDHDDRLSPDALFQNVKVLNEDREADVIYSDEDKIDQRGAHIDPHFKPDWSPDTFLSRNYICHLVLLRTALVREAGGFRKGFEGSQDYDLLLRVTEKARSIRHISLILYHWRLHAESTSRHKNAKPYAYDSGVKALEEALARRNIKGTVSLIENSHGFYSIRYEIFRPGKVSVIIPTKNRADLCEAILHSMFTLTSYPDFEVILIDNNSNEDSFFDMVKKWEEREPERFRCLTDNEPFNFSRLVNRGAKEAKGEYILLLNNDTEVIHADWMSAMVEQAQFKTTGAVGARLLYPDDTIQHAGVLIGIGGAAGHHHVKYDKDAGGYYFCLIAVNNYSAVTAACVLVRTELFREVGGFDEQLVVEFNDVDFCLRLMERGYRNIYLPHVTLYHYESISRGHPHKTKRSFRQHLLDLRLFDRRWKKYIEADPHYNIHFSRVFSDFRLNLDD